MGVRGGIVIETKYYIAYGSNLNKEQMEDRCPGAKVVGTAELKNYRLLFKGSLTGSYLTVEPEMGCSVPVGVWEGNASKRMGWDLLQVRKILPFDGADNQRRSHPHSGRC
jgi:hypothetical protein